MKKSTVMIIGAGMAGVSAGRALHDAGIEVTILEARDRMGGRIWTHSDLGTPVDLGASWIHGVKKNPIQDLSKHHNIRTHPTDWDAFILYSADGERIPDKKLDRAEAFFEELMAQLDEDREELDEDTSLANGIADVLAEHDLSAEDRQLLDFVIGGEIEHDYAANTSEMSLWWWDQDEEFKGKHVIFPQGYHQIIEKLADGLDVRLNTPIEKITYGEDGVTVTTQAGDEMRGSHVVVTVPLGVLKAGTIEFSPPLPADKQGAIQKLGMGMFHKTYLRFPDVFWDEDTEFIGYLSANKDEWITWMNYNYYVDEPILLAINTGQFAQRLERMSDEQVLDRAMAVLRKIYGDAIPQPERYLLTSWGHDPYSKGAYSYIPVGADGDAYKTLAQPLAEHLFFAGEATTRQYPSTVHGAYLSGQREAKQIIKLLR